MQESFFIDLFHVLVIIYIFYFTLGKSGDSRKNGNIAINLVLNVGGKQNFHRLCISLSLIKYPTQNYMKITS